MGTYKVYMQIMQDIILQTSVSYKASKFVYIDLILFIIYYIYLTGLFLL